MAELALLGGPKIRTEPFPAYRVMGDQELGAARRVLESGVLSRFLGTWHPDFYGGPEVRALEQEWAGFFGARHAIAVNSATSGLICAVGALGVGPGDEVIVPPYTMSATASSVLVYNAVPVFADVEPGHFCLDPAALEARITPRTKAVLAVDLFGQPCDADRVNEIARRHGLRVIEDCAQAPGALYRGRRAGTLGDIGVFSLNYHKHIHTGEGGVVVTDDDGLAERVRLIRNHAEAVLAGRGFASAADLANMVGFNFRMTEIEAAIGREQLRKLPELIAARVRNVERLTRSLAGLDGLEPAGPREGATHVYYVHPLLYREAIVGVPRERFVDAVRAELPLTRGREAEGVLIGCGYVPPLYLLPLYQNRIAWGGRGCPFTCAFYGGTPDYRRGLCPVTERLHERELITHELMRPPMTQRDLDDVAAAFGKVWEHREALR